MSVVEQFTATPAYTVAGVGPYRVAHGYRDAADLVVTATAADGQVTTLGAGDFGLVPVTSYGPGDLTLTAAAAAAHAGATLRVGRQTPIEQGWAAAVTVREQGLARQMAHDVMALQDVARATDGAVRIEGVQPVLSGSPGALLQFDPAGQIVVAAGSASAFLADAQEAALRAELAAMAALVGPPYPDVAAGLQDTEDGNIFAVLDGRGLRLHRNDDGSAVTEGWLGAILYDDAADLLAADDTYAAGTVLQTRREGLSYICVDSGGHVRMAGGTGQRLSVVPGACGYDVRAWGAQGDGATDDTAAVQAALDVATDLDGPLYFVGAFSVTNLLIRHNVAWDVAQPFWSQTTRMVGAAGARIVARAGGSSRYLVASERWAGNVSFPQGPVYCEGLVFDAASIKDIAFCNVGFASVFRNCIFDGGIEYGALEPTETDNGTAMQSGRYGVRYERCKFRFSGIGFAVGVEIVDAYVTDFWFTDNELYDNGINAVFSQAAGWKISRNHAWNHGVAPDAAASYSVYVEAAYTATLSNNIWEGYPGQTYGLFIKADVQPPKMDGDSYLLGKGLFVQFTQPASVVVSNCSFHTTEALLTHGTSMVGADILTRGCQFDAPFPYTFTGGASHAGRILSDGDTVQGVSRRMTGWQRQDIRAAQTVPGIAYWSTDAAFSCTDATPEIVTLTTPLSAVRAFDLDVAPMSGMRRILRRPASSTGANADIYPAGAGAPLISVTPGAAVTVQYDGVSWQIVYISDA